MLDIKLYKLKENNNDYYYYRAELSDKAKVGDSWTELNKDTWTFDQLPLGARSMLEEITGLQKKLILNLYFTDKS